MLILIERQRVKIDQMRAGLRKLFPKLRTLEKVVLVLLALYVLVPPLRLATLVFLWIFGGFLALRYVRLLSRKALWRLRNRLVIAYLFIAVVPVVLILVLAGIGGYVLLGQVAAHLVSSELERRLAEMKEPARTMAQATPFRRPEVLPYLHHRFPGMEVQIAGNIVFRYPDNAVLAAPPKGWKEASGVIQKEGRLYGWAHAVNQGREVTIVAPLTSDFLTSLVPSLGDVSVLSESANTGRVPPRYNRFDADLFWAALVSAGVWEAPNKVESILLPIHTRPSAVLGAVFGPRVQFTQGVLYLFLGVATAFLIVELVSLIFGISLSRTITRAVHSLYEGTQKVREGAFSHRIEVRGSDQLAELGKSFNIMTENLERLIAVEKEQQRLQSELEIAREVQNQLFPKEIPALQTLALAGVCHPARMVSGDYYDFLCLADSSVALAIGDVAGKGISAALLMASIQSIMRTLLTGVAPMAAAAGNGGTRRGFSTAHLVEQLNRQLHCNTSAEKYATFYFGLYDEQSSLLTYTNAGHPPPILLRNGEAQCLEVTGTIVGAFPFSNYEERQILLRSGDLLVAYTDGISEPENEYGEMFGEERLKDVLVKYAARDSAEIMSRVVESVRQWTGVSELQDDMTLLLARRL